MRTSTHFGKVLLIQFLRFSGSILGELKFPTISFRSCNLVKSFAILVSEERIVFSPSGAPDNSGLATAEALASLFLFVE